MNLNDLLKLVDTRWHEAFLVFIETGEAEEEFLSYLDKDENCQNAVDMAFTAQAKAFEDFAKALSAAEPIPPAQIQEERRVATVSASMATALEEALDLSPEVRKDVLKKTASVLWASIKPQQQEELKSMVEDLERKVVGFQPGFNT